MAKKTASAATSKKGPTAKSKSKSKSKKNNASSYKIAERTTIERRKEVATKKKAAAKKKSAAKRKTAARYSRSSNSGLYLPTDHAEPVDASKLRSGIREAKREIGLLLDDLSNLSDDLDVSEIELTASFDVQGKFLGIGVGGATAIAIRLKPKC